MLNFDDLKGMAVLSAKEGRELGRVAHAVVALKQRKVIGLILEGDKGETKVIATTEILTYGKDAVMASSEEKVVTLDDLTRGKEDAASSRQIIGLKIITKDGEKVGRIGSICFNEKNGLITHYVVSESIFSDLVHGTGLMPADGTSALSRDALVVTKTSAEISEVMKSDPGLVGRTGAVIEKTETGIKKAVKKMEHMVKHEKPHDQK
jgi:uncharacterized protein YrrD